MTKLFHFLNDFTLKLHTLKLFIYFFFFYIKDSYKRMNFKKFNQDHYMAFTYRSDLCQLDTFFISQIIFHSSNNINFRTKDSLTFKQVYLLKLFRIFRLICNIYNELYYYYYFAVCIFYLINTIVINCSFNKDVLTRANYKNLLKVYFSITYTYYIFSHLH